MRPGFPVSFPGLLILVLAGGCTLNDPLAMLGGGLARPSPPGLTSSQGEVAESACLAEARRDFDVVRISGATPVTDASGLVVGRDVMVQVRRTGRTFDVRCRYDYAAGTARMMVL